MLLMSAVLRFGAAGQAMAEDADVDDISPVTVDAPVATASPEIAEVLHALQVREADLTAREERIANRMQALRIAEEEVAQQIAALQDAEENLRATIALADAAATTDLERLTRVYENMKPKDAAALFEQMSPGFASGFLAMMDPVAAAQIMTLMTPESAYSISAVLAGRNANVPTR